MPPYPSPEQHGDNNIKLKVLEWHFEFDIAHLSILDYSSLITNVAEA